MMSKNSIGRLVWIMIIAVIFSCYGFGGAFAASEPKRGGTLTVSTPADLNGVDPHTSPVSINGEVLNHVFEALVGYGEKMEFVPVLAERWEISPDYKTYTFYIRKGKLFHNGRELVADDVKYSIDRVMDPKTGCARRSDFVNAIERIEVKDKYTVVFYMKKGSASLLYLLAYPYPAIAIVPKEEVEKQGGVLKQPVGTGPYKFVEWKPDQYVLLERFDQYKPQPGPKNGYGGERVAYMDRIKWVIVKEDSVTIMALLNKEIDTTRTFPVSYLEKYREDYAKRGLILQEVPSLGTVNVFFGCDKPFTKNVKFRQACAYAVDLETLARAARPIDARVNSSMIVPESPYWTPYHKTWYKKDVNKAKQLLQEAGYKGEEVTIDTTKQYIEYYRLAVALQAELMAVGINAKLNVLEVSSMLKKYFDSDFQMLTHSVLQADPTLAYAFYRNNRFDDEVPKIKEIREEADKTLDLNVRKKLFEEAHRLQYQYVPALSVHQPVMPQCHWDFVKGYKPHPTLQSQFWGVWLDK